MLRGKPAFAALACAVLALSLPACKKNEPVATTPAPAPAAQAPAAAVRVTDAQVGKALGADKKVSQPADSFAPMDTIFVSVTTEGSAPSAAIRANWKFQDGQTVKDDTRTITPTGARIGRNDPCWCGSGAKYKKCHGR